MIVLPSKLKVIDRIVFAPTSQLLAVGGGDRKPVEIWSLASPDQSLHRLPVRLQNAFLSFRFTSTGEHLVLAQDTEVIGFEVASATEVWRFKPEEIGVIAGVDLSANGRYVGVCLFYQYHFDGGYQLWELSDSNAPRQVSKSRGTEENLCRGLIFLPSKNCWVFAEDNPSKNSAKLLVKSQSGRASTTLTTKYQMVRQMAVSPDGRYLAALFGKAILVWSSVDFQKVPKKILSDSKLAFTGIAFHPSGRYFAASSNDTTANLYDTETWQNITTYTWDIGRLRSIAFSPDGSLAAVGSDTGKIVVWDVDV